MPLGDDVLTECVGGNTGAPWCNDPNRLYYCYSSAYQCCDSCRRAWTSVRGISDSYTYILSYSQLGVIYTIIVYIYTLSYFRL